jgi:putative transposase
MMLSTSVSTGLKARKPNPMKTTYQYRIYPTMKQHKALKVWLDACRTLYNQALDMKKQAYDKREENITYKTQAAYLTTLRNVSQFWQNKHCDVLQDTLRRLDKLSSVLCPCRKRGRTRISTLQR